MEKTAAEFVGSESLKRKTKEISDSVRLAIFNRTGIMADKDVSFHPENVFRKEYESVKFIVDEPFPTKELGILSEALSSVVLSVAAAIYENEYAGLGVRISYEIKYRRENGGTNGIPFEEHYKISVNNRLNKE